MLLGTSVYSIGITQGIGAIFSGLSRGEVNAVTRLIYEARENCLAHIHREATEIKADAVIGTKLFIHEIGASMVEVLAIGTPFRREISRNEAMDVAPDGLSAELTLPLVKDRVYMIGAKGGKSSKGEPLVQPVGAYTLLEIPQ